MKTLSTITLAVLAASAAHAGHDSETVKLTPNQCFQVNAALAKLDEGIMHVIQHPAQEGKDAPPPDLVMTAYEFPPATRLAIYRDRRALEGVLSDYDKARDAEVRKVWGAAKPNESKDIEQMAKFKADMDEVANVSQPVEITKLHPEDLLKSGNPIPAIVLIQLQPILTDK